MYILSQFYFVPMRSHHFLYLLTFNVVSYIGIPLAGVAARLGCLSAWIMLAAVIIGVVWRLSVVKLKGIILSRYLAFVVRPHFKIAGGALRSCRYLWWGLIAFAFSKSCGINIRLHFLWLLKCSMIEYISRRLMCKNETLFLFRRHCLIHYNHIKINNFIILNYCSPRHI